MKTTVLHQTLSVPQSTFAYDWCFVALVPKSIKKSSKLDQKNEKYQNSYFQAFDTRKHSEALDGAKLHKIYQDLQNGQAEARLTSMHSCVISPPWISASFLKKTDFNSSTHLASLKRSDTCFAKVSS